MLWDLESSDLGRKNTKWKWDVTWKLHSDIVLDTLGQPWKTSGHNSLLSLKKQTVATNSSNYLSSNLRFPWGFPTQSATMVIEGVIPARGNLWCQDHTLMTCNVDTREMRHRPGLHDFLRQTKEMGVEELKHVEPCWTLLRLWVSDGFGSSLCCMAWNFGRAWKRRCGRLFVSCQWGCP